MQVPKLSMQMPKLRVRNVEAYRSAPYISAETCIVFSYIFNQTLNIAHLAANQLSMELNALNYTMALICTNRALSELDESEYVAGQEEIRDRT